MSEQSKYAALWTLDAYRSNSPGEGYASLAVEKLIKPGSSVIDFGCGTGRGSRKLADLGCRVLAIDFVYNCLDGDINIPFLIADLTNLPYLRADYGFCCDVMEHIEPQRVDGVLSAIARSVVAAFFSIALHRDNAGRLIGQTLHLTVESADWWKAKLLEHFGSISWSDDNGTTLVAVCHRSSI